MFFGAVQAPVAYREHYVRTLYEIIYGGARNTIPTIDQMVALPEQFLARSLPLTYGKEDLLTVTAVEVTDRMKSVSFSKSISTDSASQSTTSLAEDARNQLNNDEIHFGKTSKDDLPNITPAVRNQDRVEDTPIPTPYVLPSPDPNVVALPIRQLIFSDEGSPESIRPRSARTPNAERLSFSFDEAPPVPPTIEPGEFRAITMFDYVPAADECNTLEVRKNTIVTVVLKANDDWWLVRLPSGEEGYIPANILLPSTESPTT